MEIGKINDNTNKMEEVQPYSTKAKAMEITEKEMQNFIEPYFIDTASEITSLRTDLIFYANLITEHCMRHKGITDGAEEARFYIDRLTTISAIFEKMSSPTNESTYQKIVSAISKGLNIRITQNKAV